MKQASTGIYMGGEGNTIKDNIANGNTSTGIFMQGGSTNLITKNTALNNGIYDMGDTPCTNTWKKNVFVTTYAPGPCLQ